MADFRKWLIAFAALALLLGVAGTANAQIGLQNPAFSCVANAGVPPIVRAEGITELVGDLILNCTGGQPTQKGSPIPLSNVTIFLTTNITSRIVGSGNLSEATLMIDEPNACSVVPAPATPANTCPPGNVTSVPNNTVVLPPPGSPVQILCTPQGNPCPGFGTFVGVPSPSPYASWTPGVSGAPNVYSGRQASANSVVWNGVPIDAPGTAGTRVIRITNVRGNAFQLGVSSSLVPSQITMFISVNGSEQVTINNPTQTVAFIQPGLIVGGTNTTLVQCINNNDALVRSSGGFITGTDFTIRVTEGFASSFKRRNLALTSDGTTSPSPVPQNVPGYPYNTESGFYAPGLFTATPIVGLADFGTRIRIQFNNIGAGVRIFVPAKVPLVVAPSNSTSFASATTPAQPPAPVTPGIGNGQLTLVSTDATGNSAPGFSAVAGTVNGNTLAEVNYSGTNTAYAVYEVVNSDVNVVERGNINVFVAFISNTGQNLPGTGVSTTSTGFAPVSSVSTADATAPIPRFGDASVPRNAFSINPCTCDLLFPFVTNVAGFDTGIAIANTSLDPFGTATQQGLVTLFYFGTTNGLPPPPGKQVTNAVVPAGSELIFTLGNGGNFGIQATPGFQGYIISVANFQYCHAFAFISDVGAQKLAEGYLAIQLDNPGLNRTGVFGENEGH